VQRSTSVAVIRVFTAADVLTRLTASSVTVRAPTQASVVRVRLSLVELTTKPSSFNS